MIYNQDNIIKRNDDCVYNAHIPLQFAHFCFGRGNGFSWN